MRTCKPDNSSHRSMQPDPYGNSWPFPMAQRLHAPDWNSTAVFAWNLRSFFFLRPVHVKSHIGSQIRLIHAVERRKWPRLTVAMPNIHGQSGEMRGATFYLTVFWGNFKKSQKNWKKSQKKSEVGREISPSPQNIRRRATIFVLKTPKPLLWKINASNSACSPWLPFKFTRAPDFR